MTLSIGRILGSLAMIVFVGAIAVSATGAFFSDTETSTGNTFTAGDIDLQIDNTSYVTSTSTGELIASPWTSWTMQDLIAGTHHFFDFIDLKPGDIGEDTISIHVGSNNAWMCAAARVTVDSDETCTEPEDTDESGNCVPETDGTNGDLADEMNFAFWNDDGDNVFEVNEDIFLEGPLSGLGSQDQITLADSQSSILGGTAPIPGDSTFYIGKAWCYGTLTEAPLPDRNDPNPSLNNPLNRGTGFICDGSTADNKGQTDKVEGDLQFYAVQSRNNDDFLCSQGYTPDWGGEVEPPVRPEVGALLSAYVQPDSEFCAVTVVGSESIQTAVTAAAINSTVCVDPTYDMTGDNTAIRIEILGLTLAATVRGVNLDVPVVLSNTNVTVTGFDGLIGQAESPAEQAAFYVDADADLFEISFNTVTGGVGAAILTETGGALGGGLIANNELSGATQGIYTNPHTGVFVIEYNDIDDNAAGIGGLMGAIVRNNEFEHTLPGSEAIGVDPTHDANPATVEFNNFLDNIRVNTYGPIAGDVSAINNFWGPTGGASQTNVTDEVIFTPEEVSAFPHN